MAVASYKTIIKLSGTTTVFTSEAMSSSTASNQHQISDDAKRVWDRDTVPVIRQSSLAAIVPAAQISNIDYLFGKITFASSTQGTPITASGTYLPLASVAGSHTYQLNHIGGLLDDTAFESTGWRTHKQGIRDVNITLSRWDSLDTDFFDHLKNGTTFLVEVTPGGSTAFLARGWFIGESEIHSGDVNSLEQGDITLHLDGDTNAAYRWSDQ